MTSSSFQKWYRSIDNHWTKICLSLKSAESLVRYCGICRCSDDVARVPYVYVCMYVCMYGCMDGWMDGWMGVRACVRACMHACMYACMYVCSVWDLGSESSIQQRKTTYLLSIRISLACARASKLTTTCISPEPGARANLQWGRVGWMLADHRDELSSSIFLAWSSIAQSVCQQAFSLLEIGFQRPSGFESCIQQRKTTCLLWFENRLPVPEHRN